MVSVTNPYGRIKLKNIGLWTNAKISTILNVTRRHPPTTCFRRESHLDLDLDLDLKHVSTAAILTFIVDYNLCCTYMYM
jgi:hypothetical protein